MVVVIIGGALLLLGVALIVRKAATLAKSVITLGHVDELLPTRGRKSGTTYKVKATFTDQHGLPHTYVSSWSASHPGYGVGDPIRIAYLPGDAERGSIASFGYAFGFAVVVAVIGLALLLAGGAYRIGGAMMETWYPLTPLATHAP